MAGNCLGHLGGCSRLAIFFQRLQAATSTEDRNISLFSEGSLARILVQAKSAGIDTDDLSNISGERMLDRASPLNPVIFPHAPQRRNAHRRVGGPEIVRIEGSEDCIAATTERVEPPWTPQCRGRILSSPSDEILHDLAELFGEFVDVFLGRFLSADVWSTLSREGRELLG